MYVGVKNGATTLTLTPRSFAFRCDARASPTTPCLDEMYETTPVPPKYPDVEATRITAPFAPSESGELEDMECMASRSAVDRQHISGLVSYKLTVHGSLQIDIDNLVCLHWLFQLPISVLLKVEEPFALHQPRVSNYYIDLTESVLRLSEESSNIAPTGDVGR